MATQGRSTQPATIKSNETDDNNRKRSVDESQWARGSMNDGSEFTRWQSFESYGIREIIAVAHVVSGKEGEGGVWGMGTHTHARTYTHTQTHTQTCKVD